MTISPLASELAADKHRTLLRDAAAFRRARSARPARRPSRLTRLTLQVRPIRPDDATLLNSLFEGLSAGSRLARFLHVKTHLTLAELRYFTEVDHHDHEALVAVTWPRGDIVGVARFIREREDPSSADISVVIADQWQDWGVGSMLAERLARRAVAENVLHFTALIAAGNVRARRLLGKVGDVALVERDRATVAYRVTLPGRVSVPTRLGAGDRQPDHAPHSHDYVAARDVVIKSFA